MSWARPARGAKSKAAANSSVLLSASILIESEESAAVLPRFLDFEHKQRRCRDFVLRSRPKATTYQNLWKFPEEAEQGWRGARRKGLPRLRRMEDSRDLRCRDFEQNRGDFLGFEQNRGIGAKPRQPDDEYKYSGTQFTELTHFSELEQDASNLYSTMSHQELSEEDALFYTDQYTPECTDDEQETLLEPQEPIVAEQPQASSSTAQRQPRATIRLSLHNSTSELGNTAPPKDYAISAQRRRLEAIGQTNTLKIVQILSHENRSVRNGGIHFKVKSRTLGETYAKPNDLLYDMKVRKLLRKYLRNLMRKKSRRLPALHRRIPQIFYVFKDKALLRSAN